MNNKSSYFLISFKYLLIYLLLIINLSFGFDQNDKVNQNILPDIENVLFENNNNTKSTWQNIDISNLLKINFINLTTQNYQQKFSSFQSSIENHFLDSFQDLMQPTFSNEFNDKLNLTYFEFLNSLELSTKCLKSFDFLINEVLFNSKLWPLKCKFFRWLF